MEETISTLKFATRAKSIKTKFKMNIKSTPETYQLLIKQLQLELAVTKGELHKFKLLFHKLKEELAQNGTQIGSDDENHVKFVEFCKNPYSY